MFRDRPSSAAAWKRPIPKTLCAIDRKFLGPFTEVEDGALDTGCRRTCRTNTGDDALAISGEPSMPPVSDLSGCGACGTGVEDTG
mmetsp:Transcript_152550/g.265872  ORF Transcript_152550/g.265872 Transcript_152550/m.265872 type:complete len:85 (+) Transcript_152550:203-457(+)